MLLYMGGMIPESVMVIVIFHNQDAKLVIGLMIIESNYGAIGLFHDLVLPCL